MKAYITSVLRLFFYIAIGFHLIVFLMLFGMWQLERFPEMYEADAFWVIFRILIVFSLIVPAIFKFKIVRYNGKDIFE